MKKPFEKIMPFIFFGVMLVILALGILLFSYILIVGAIIGFIIYLVARIKEKFFPSRQMTKTKNPEKPGRIIDHDEH